VNERIDDKSNQVNRFVCKSFDNPFYLFIQVVYSHAYFLHNGRRKNECKPTKQNSTSSKPNKQPNISLFTAPINERIVCQVVFSSYVFVNKAGVEKFPVF
jgi:hypothetical protein